MSPSDEPKVTADSPPDDFQLPPPGIALQLQGNTLVMRFKELARAGYIVGGLCAWFLITVVVYGLANNVPTSEYLWAAVIFAFPLYLAVAMIVNVTTVSASDTELSIVRGPLPIWFNKRIPTPQIASLHIQVHRNKRTNSYSVVAALTDGKKRKRVVGAGRDHDLAHYFTSVLSTQLGLSEGERLPDPAVARSGPRG